MAFLVNTGTGNFGTAATWQVPKVMINGAAANTALTTSYQSSSAFQLTGEIITHLGFKVASRTASPTGTITVGLRDENTLATVASATINISDIDIGDSAANGGAGWYYLALTVPYTSIVARNYSLQLKTSSSSQVNCFSTSAALWYYSLLQATPTTQAPAADDQLIITGIWTAAATLSSYTVTMDNTAATPDVRYVQVNKGATFAYAASASTNYYYKQTANVDLFSGSTMSMGTTGTPIPASSTAILEFDAGAAAGSGLNVGTGATFIAQGASKTRKTLMTADKAAAATVILVTDTTGWAAGDELAFASTTRTASESEKKTILTVDSSTQITLTAGLTNAHSGTSPTQAEVANLTSNVKIRGVSALLTGFLNFRSGGLVDMDHIEMTNLGSGSLAAVIYATNTTGAGTAAGPASIRYSSLHDLTIAGTIGFRFSPGFTSGTIECSDNVTYSITDRHFYCSQTVSSGSPAWTMNNNLAIKNSTNALYEFVNGAWALTFTNNTAVSGINLGIYLNGSTAMPIGTWSGNTAHSNATSGLYHMNGMPGTISNSTLWRNNNYGLYIDQNNVSNEQTATSTGIARIFDGITAFGNQLVNVNFNVQSAGTWIFKNMVLNAGATLTCPIGFQFQAAYLDSCYIEDSDFGFTTAHATADVTPVPGQNQPWGPMLMLHNCRLASTTEFANQDGLSDGFYFPGIQSSKHDGTAGSFKIWKRKGVLSSDTAIYNTASPSLRMTPNSNTISNIRLIGAIKQIPVASGGTVTVSAYVRQSSAGDGANYTGGGAARLMLKRNYPLGITADTVIATYSATNGTWQQLTGTTTTVTADGVLEFYVDCWATAGWINVDDFTTTASLNTSDFKYWLYATPILGNISASGGVAGGSFPFC